jgi:hypothetical protein
MNKEETQVLQNRIYSIYQKLNCLRNMEKIQMLHLL